MTDVLVYAVFHNHGDREIVPQDLGAMFCRPHFAGFVDGM